MGTIAFLIGLLGTAVGAGIALPHAAKSGFASMTVVGLICLVGMSMGGEEAVGALRSTRESAPFVAEGVTGRAAVDKEWLSASSG